MQNYRSNAMPYNTYRQAQGSSRMDDMRRDNMRRDDMRRDDMRRNDMRRDDMRRDSRNVLDNMPLAMAYVPWQTWRDIYDAEKGFHRGTIFQELDLPFLGKGGKKR